MHEPIPGVMGPPEQAGGIADPGQLKNAKLLRGCGGCGCAFALVAFLVGVVLVGFGTQRATREAMPFGIITTGLAVPIALIAIVLLVLGISKLKKLGG